MSRIIDAPVSSFWLMPGPEDARLLEGIVDELAARHHTPRFTPHLTLLGNVPLAPEGAEGLLAAIAQAAGPWASPVADIVTGAAFFRSFYALFDAEPSLGALRSATAETTGLDGGPFMPHISLLYGPVEAAAKAASAEAIRGRLKGRAIRFDHVVVTNSADHVPIDDWRVVFSRPLGSA